MERDPSPAEISSSSAHDEPGQTGDATFPGPPGQQKGAALDSGLSFLCFPRKLWKMLESNEFQSIWWGKNGKCVAINEELFKEEVLARQGSLQIFATRKMKSFVRQLNHYGFTKVQQDYERSASLPEFLAEERAVSAHSQILYYYNPIFNRENPQLLERCKRRVGVKRKAEDALAMGESQPSRSPDDQAAGDTQVSQRVTTPTKRQAKTPPGFGSNHPSPPAAAPVLPEAAGAAGHEMVIPPAAFLLPALSSQTLEGLQCAPPSQSVVPTVATASGLLWPRPPHCPTCTCRPNSADEHQHGTS